MSDKPTPVHVTVTALVLAVLTVGVWWAFLGWDTQKDFDPATSTYSGPYEIWQVLGCGAALVVLVVLGSLRIPALVTAPVVAVTFTAAWSIGAATSSTDSLWLVGAGMVLFGLLVGGALVGGLTRKLAGRTAA
ncbi:hypothetical protein JOF53_001497 [Crossiella equi]|uniref:Uncharacterized protein n=1 Tax=Crossiella equi TaxID=130796 RepID=A0ABS5A7S7_9PSEU|nr:hypothetical protein [Crossiella equi]MBP2472625.1 hypothetical protein [Crossiella equi]